MSTHGKSVPHAIFRVVNVRRFRVLLVIRITLGLDKPFRFESQKFRVTEALEPVMIKGKVRKDLGSKEQVQFLTWRAEDYLVGGFQYGSRKRTPSLLNTWDSSTDEVRSGETSVGSTSDSEKYSEDFGS